MTAFPGPDDLCEECGYSLHGLVAGHGCPECGAALSVSDPALRPGLPWQHRRSLGPFLHTAISVTLHPGRSFRQLRVSPPPITRGRGWLVSIFRFFWLWSSPNGPDRIFLLILTFGLGLAVTGTYLYLRLSYAWLWGLIVVSGILVGSYTEALGVSIFARRRGWRVPFDLAERVVCYAAVGWVPAIALMAFAELLFETGRASNWWNPKWGSYTTGIDLALSGILISVSVMWFEVLVWLGVRKVKYANAAR
jgi:hypothetical protein